MAASLIFSYRASIQSMGYSAWRGRFLNSSTITSSSLFTSDTCDAEICSIPMLLASRSIFRVEMPLPRLPDDLHQSLFATLLRCHKEGIYHLYVISMVRYIVPIRVSIFEPECH